MTAPKAREHYQRARQMGFTTLEGDL